MHTKRITVVFEHAQQAFQSFTLVTKIITRLGLHSFAPSRLYNIVVERRRRAMYAQNYMPQGHTH